MPKPISFEHKEVDKEGLKILQTIEAADKFNNWMFETIRPFCRNNILEIGSGTGNISREFIQNGYQIWLSDIRKNYCQILKEKFSEKENVGGIELMDLVDPEFDSKHAHLFNSFNTVFALNVVEHIEDDLLAIKNSKKLLKKGGRIIILVPAYQSLYNNFDKELFHYKRYRRKDLNALIANGGFNVIHSSYFNLMGIFGWFFSGTILKKKTIPSGQMKLYNTLVPVFKVLDKITAQKAGLSVLSIGEKNH